MFDVLKASCALVSTRNSDVPGCEYVPCVSAMSPLFDTLPEPGHDVLLFAHARKSDGMQRPSGIPAMDDHAGTLEETLAFLASGATVVTNSYYGTYWAMCPGRRVLCLPFSDKFRKFERNPVSDWLEMLPKAETREGVLEDALAHNGPVAATATR